MALKILRRGKPETRTNFERARDNFTKGKGQTRVMTKVRPCPECGNPMNITQSYKDPDAYEFKGVCSKDPGHYIERYGYFSTDTETTT